VAARSEVEVLISADSKKLEKAFGNVGAAAKEMAGDLDKAETDAKMFGKAMDGAAGAADASEGKFMGAADLLDGLGGAFGLPTEGATNMMRSFGDLSGGFAALGPLIKGFGASLAGLAMNPVVLGVAALAAGLVILWKNSETFRDIVTGAFQWVMDKVGPIIDTIGKGIGWLADKLGIGGPGDKAEEMTEAMKAALEASQEDWDNWKDAVTTSLDDILNPLQRARDNSKASLNEITTNLADNAAFYSGWINNLTSLTERGFGELASYFHSLGPEAEKAVGEATRLTDPQLAKLQANINNKLQGAGETAADLLTQGLGGKDYGKIGESIGQQVAGGLHRVFAPGTIGHQFVTGGGGLLGPLPRRAAGGPVAAGSPYIVGERGPELFVPGMSGAVVPNAAAAGGTTVIQLVLDGRVVTEVVHDGLLAKQRRTPLGLAS